MPDSIKRLRRRTRNSGMKLGNRNAQQYNIRAEGEPIFVRLRAGDYFTVACRRAGVPVATAKKWLELGKSGQGTMCGTNICGEDHVWFYEEVMRALAEVEGKAVDTWTTEILKGNWQAARDFLSRRFPHRWGSSEHRLLKVRSDGQMELHLAWDDDEEQEENTLP